MTLVLMLVLVCVSLDLKLFVSSSRTCRSLILGVQYNLSLLALDPASCSLFVGTPGCVNHLSRGLRFIWDLRLWSFCNRLLGRRYDKLGAQPELGDERIHVVEDAILDGLARTVIIYMLTNEATISGLLERIQRIHILAY